MARAKRRADVDFPVDRIVAYYIGRFPGMSNRAIGKMLHLSERTIAEERKRLEIDFKCSTDLNENDAIEAYKAGIRAVLPKEKRAARIAEIAKSKKNPFASLKAIQYADAVEGVGPQAERSDGGNAQQAAFILPEGTSIRIQLTARDQRMLKQRPEINVTPDSVEDALSGEATEGSDED